MSKTYKFVSNPNVILLNAAKYGVPQIRERVILIGVRKDIDLDPLDVYNSIKKTHSVDGKKKYVTVREAICDLPKLQPGEGNNEVSFVTSADNDFINKIKSKDGVLYNHVARNHNDTDREVLLSEDEIVIVKNPFAAEWVDDVIHMVEESNKFFVLVTPFVEDLLIEPKGIFNYVQPLFTESFVSYRARKKYLPFELS